ncbi:MAG: hypothetical protein IJ085_08410 [Turicibacter sp.]|nr:hypothetical protein [Turicibacter sp.]
MNFKKINTILSLFWLGAAILIVVLDINGTIRLTSNPILFFGVIISMVVSFQIVSYLEKKSKKN